MNNGLHLDVARLRRAVEDGDANAALQLSLWYRTDHNIDGATIYKDELTAGKYLEKAASLGHPLARELIRPVKRTASAAESYESIGTYCTGLLVVVGICVPLLVLGFQTYSWLKTGGWPPMPVNSGAKFLDIDEPIIDYLVRLEWIGVQKILVWIYFKMSLALFTFLASVVLAFATSYLFDSQTQRKYKSIVILQKQITRRLEEHLKKEPTP